MAKTLITFSTGSTFMEATIHHELSVSATKKNGRISLGASHYLNQDDLPLKEQGALNLIEIAKNRIVQVRGKYNNELPHEDLAKVREWFDEFFG